MAHITGIDLGTTNSAAAILNELGKTEIVPNVDSDRITPSVLLFGESADDVEVGSAAIEFAGNLTPAEATRYVYEIKRKMPDLDHRVNILGKSFSPTALSALILQKASSGVKKHRGGIGTVAISVPAYFHEAERKATLEAGKLAGLDVVSIVNEPTAAALAYAATHQLDGNYLVFDLGGGTFDVTVLEGTGQDINVLTTQGNRQLGGSDFDRAILEIFKEAYKSGTGEELCVDNADGSQDGSTITNLLHAQRSKHMLSKKVTHRIKLVNMTGGKHVDFTITRKQFEEAISVQLASAEMLMELALEDANLQPSEITNVLLVGGSTRVPAVYNLVHKHFDKIPATDFNPDEAVALGAAIHAGYSTVRERPDFPVPRSMQREINKNNVVDVVNHSYGTIVTNSETKERENVIIIKKNTSLPATHEETFYTAHDDQEYVGCHITQGDEEDPEFLPPPIYKGLMKLPPGRPAGQAIRVQFKCDDDHILHYYFEDVESGKFHEGVLRLTASSSSNVDDNEAPVGNVNIL